MNTRTSRTRAIIVGGGIGGLTAALRLHRAGLDVDKVIPCAELEAISQSYQQTPGFDRESVNRKVS